MNCNTGTIVTWLFENGIGLQVTYISESVIEFHYKNNPQRYVVNELGRVWQVRPAGHDGKIEVHEQTHASRVIESDLQRFLEGATAPC